jgi:hypothetical protein
MRSRLRERQAAAVAAGSRTPPRMLCRLVAVAPPNASRAFGRSSALPAEPYADAFVKLAGEPDECNTWAWSAGDAFVMVAFAAAVEQRVLGHFFWIMYPNLSDT